MASDRLVVLGVVTRAHGVYGELRIKFYNPGSELLDGQPEVVLRVNGEARPVQVVSCRPQGTDSLLLQIEGCASRSDAEGFRGAELCVPRSALPAPAQDEYYLADLSGLAAILPNGELVGRIQEVISYPAADVLLVQSVQGLIEVPILERYLVKVEIDAGRVVVDHIDELDRQKPKKKTPSPPASPARGEGEK